MGYNRKNESTLTFNANKKRLRNEAQILLDALMNDALSEMSDEFEEALIRGEVQRIEGTREDLREYLRRASERVLGAAPTQRRLNVRNDRS